MEIPATNEFQNIAVVQTSLCPRSTRAFIKQGSPNPAQNNVMSLKIDEDPSSNKSSSEEETPYVVVVVSK